MSLILQADVIFGGRPRPTLRKVFWDCCWILNKRAGCTEMHPRNGRHNDPGELGASCQPPQLVTTSSVQVHLNSTLARLVNFISRVQSPHVWAQQPLDPSLQNGSKVQRTWAPVPCSHKQFSHSKSRRETPAGSQGGPQPKKGISELHILTLGGHPNEARVIGLA